MSSCGISGPYLQRQLTLRRQQIPIVFIRAHADETIRSRLLAQGAVACLFKPANGQAGQSGIEGLGAQRCGEHQKANRFPHGG
jgi:FixJ family two-component response regulator